LRVGGDQFDVSAALANLALQPYRIDKAGTGRAKDNALHYDVSSDEAFTSGALSTAIERFITDNKKDLISLRQMRGLDYCDLDVALMIYEEMPMRSLRLSEPALKAIAEVGMSFTVSTYKASEEP
jgi:hypothetical protein